MVDFAELIERVRGATGPDRGIDEAIMSLFYIRDDRHIGAYVESDFGRDVPVIDSVWVDPETDKWVSTHPFEFTDSLDAITALIKRRALTGYCLDTAGLERPEAHVDGKEADAPTAPLALTLAFLLAFQEAVTK